MNGEGLENIQIRNKNKIKIIFENLFYRNPISPFTPFTPFTPTKKIKIIIN